MLNGLFCSFSQMGTSRKKTTCNEECFEAVTNFQVRNAIVPSVISRFPERSLVGMQEIPKPLRITKQRVPRRIVATHT